MNENELKSRLQRAYRAIDESPPGFDALWNAAEARSNTRRRYGFIAAGIAAAAAALFVGLNLLSGSRMDADDAWIAGIDESLLNATVWIAPSDALLPENESDIYRSLPALFESTEMEVESLL
jgi:hypothetical protein